MINIPKVGMYLFPHTKNRFNPPLPQNAVGAIFIPSNNCPHSLIYTRLKTDQTIGVSRIDLQMVDSS